jgi:putative membrane protein
VTIAWPLDPSVDVGLVALSVGYAWLASRCGTRWRDAAYFGAGLVVVWLALETPLDTLADRYLMSAHMAQHMLLIVVAPPLLLLGLSPAMAAALLRIPGLRRLTQPIPALALYAACMIGWHLPSLYMLGLQNQAVHIVEHLAFLAAGTLFWWPLIRATGSQAGRRLEVPQMVVYLLAGMVPMMAVSLPLQFSRQLFYPLYGSSPRLIPGITPVVDQTIAGAIMMLMEMAATGFEAVVVIGRWLSAAVRADLDQPAAAPRQPA